MKSRRDSTSTGLVRFDAGRENVCWVGTLERSPPQRGVVQGPAKCVQGPGVMEVGLESLK